MVVENIPMELIDRPQIPDRVDIDMDSVQELADSIAEVGLQNPVQLQRRDARYEIIAGDRRFQAYQLLGRHEIPAFVQVYDEATISIMRATENLQRLDLSVIEEARIYKRLHDDHEMTWEQIARKTGKSPGAVKRRYDLLRLPEILIKAMHSNRLPYATAEVLATLPNIGQIEYYLGFCLDQGASKDIVKGWVKEELSRQRQADNASVEGEWVSPIATLKPVYVACDLCGGPMDLNQVVTLRVCPDCAKVINQNMKG